MNLHSPVSKPLHAACKLKSRKVLFSVQMVGLCFWKFSLQLVAMFGFLKCFSNLPQECRNHRCAINGKGRGGIQLGMCNSCLLLVGCLVHIELLWLSPA